MTIQHLFPTAKPTLDLNFAGERSLDPKITFSRSSIGTYVDEDGIIRYAAEEEPRFDHDPLTGESLGLLIEESRTNIIPNSLCSVSNGWGFGTNSVTDNAGTAPDGTTTATFVTPESGSYNNTSPQRILPTAGAYTNSVFVKPDGLTQFTLNFLNYSDTLNQSVVFDTTQSGIDGAGIAPNSNNTENYLGATMKHYPNGWVRISISVNIVGPDLNGKLQFKSNGDGVNSFYVWHWQTEEGSFPSSLIPTTGAEVDRELDLCEILGTNFSSWFNNPAGTFSLEARTITDGPNWFFGTGLVTIANEQQINMYQGDSATTGSRRLATGMANASVIQLTENVTDSFKAAAGYEYSIGRSASYNGGTAIASNVSNINPNYLTIGSRTRPISGGKIWLGGQSWIARLAYYPRRLSDEQLEALTS